MKNGDKGTPLESEIDFNLKILMLGDSSVLKSTVTLRYISGFFMEAPKLITVVDFYSKTTLFNGKEIKLQVWIDSRDKLLSLLPTYAKGTDSAIFLYDIADRSTLNNIHNWIQLFKNYAGNVPIVLAGVNIELEENRAVAYDEGLKFVKEFNLDGFIEVSPKTGQNIEELFNLIIHLALQKYEKSEAEKINLEEKLELLEFKVNDFLTLKLEHNESFIYIKGKKFIQCIRLFLHISPQESDLYEEVESIDEAAEVFEQSLLQNRIVEGPMAKPSRFQNRTITPEQEFWGHCSNIQAWAEHDYDTKIMHSNLAFQLLKQLTFVGDPKAKSIFKEEIAIRFGSGYFSVVAYLLEQGYLLFLDKDELEILLDNNLKIEDRFIKNKDVLSSYGTLYIKIKNYPKAIEMLEKSIEIDPKSIIALFLIGVAYGILGNFNRALESFEQMSWRIGSLEKRLQFNLRKGSVYVELSLYGLALSIAHINEYHEIFNSYTSLLTTIKTSRQIKIRILDEIIRISKIYPKVLLKLRGDGRIRWLDGIGQNQLSKINPKVLLTLKRDGYARLLGKNELNYFLDHVKKIPIYKKKKPTKYNDEKIGKKKGKKKSKSLEPFGRVLQEMISEKGSSLNLKLCEQLITDLKTSLRRDLTIKDVQLAADFLVEPSVAKKLKRRKKKSQKLNEKQKQIENQNIRPPTQPQEDLHLISRLRQLKGMVKDLEKKNVEVKDFEIYEFPLILESAEKKVESIMKKESVNELTIARRYLPEIFPADLLEISKNDGHPILKPFVIRYFRSKGILTKLYGIVIKFKKHRINKSN